MNAALCSKNERITQHLCSELPGEFKARSQFNLTVPLQMHPKLLKLSWNKTISAGTP